MFYFDHNKRYSVYYHRRPKTPDNIHIWEAGIRVWTFFSNKMTQNNQLIIKKVGN